MEMSRVNWTKEHISIPSPNPWDLRIGGSSTHRVPASSRRPAVGNRAEVRRLAGSATAEYQCHSPWASETAGLCMSLLWEKIVKDPQWF